MVKTKTEHSTLFTCLRDDAPELTKDFALWIESNSDNSTWKYWSSEHLVGYVLKYISEIYVMFPEAVTDGEYEIGYPLFEDAGVPEIGAELTEFEIFCYNVIAECVRLEKNYIN